MASIISVLMALESLRSFSALHARDWFRWWCRPIFPRALLASRAVDSPWSPGKPHKRTRSGSREACRVVEGGQREPDPGRPRDADGRPAAPVLDPGMPELGDRRTGRAAGAGPPAGRGPSRVPRYRRARRTRGRAVPAPGRLTLLRPQRGVRAALHLSRLEVRRHRPVRGPAQRAEPVPAADQDHVVPRA